MRLTPGQVTSFYIVQWLDALGKKNSRDGSVVKKYKYMLERFADDMKKMKMGSQALLNYIRANPDPDSAQSTFIRECVKHYPINGTFPLLRLGSNVMSILYRLASKVEKERNISKKQRVQLQSKLNYDCRFLMRVIEKEIRQKRIISDELSQLICEIIQAVDLPKYDETSSVKDILDQGPSMTDFFPNYPKIRQRGVYPQDVTNAKQFLAKEKKRRIAEEAALTMMMQDQLDGIESQSLKCHNVHSSSAKFSPGMLFSYR